MNNKHKILKEKFGYNKFKMNQEDAIDRILDKKNTLLIMPTGGGKSVCYQIPGLMKEGVTVVVTPLLSLMKDQVDTLINMNINAKSLTSNTTKDEKKLIFRDMYNNNLKFLYASPEMLVKSELIPYLDQHKDINISLFAIDEAHCVSMWGHDFRPEYLEIGNILKQHSHIPIIALTATANEKTKQDIAKSFNIQPENILKNSFDRPNIHYSIISKKQDGYAQLKKFLKHNSDSSGIIYCAYKREVDSLVNKLKKDGFSVDGYHSDVDQQLKEDIQDDFMKDRIKLIVATTAFGMGINKSDVRFVINTTIPYSIEDYYQQTGRAGRDGAESKAIMLFSYKDANKIKNMIRNSDERSDISLEKFNEIVDIASSDSCRRNTVLKAFGEEKTEDCGKCDHCDSKEIESLDYTKFIAKDLISIIKKAGQRISLTDAAEVLKGSTSAKIKNYKKMSEYGKYSNLPSYECEWYARQLVFYGLIDEKEIETDYLDYNIIQYKITEKGFDVLHDISNITLSKPKYDLTENILKPVKSKLNMNSECFNELVRLRYSIAKYKNANPYTIIDSSTLEKIATQIPKSIAELKKIEGLGANRIKNYGTSILKVTTKYQKEMKHTDFIGIK